MRDRVYQIISELCNGNQSEFARRTGLTPQYVGDIGKNKRGVGTKTANRILEAFPQVSSVWLYTGHGNMLDTIGGIEGNQITQNNTNGNNVIGNSITIASTPDKNTEEYEDNAIPVVPQELYTMGGVDVLDYCRSHKGDKKAKIMAFDSYDLYYEMADESMQPRINIGDFLCAKTVESLDATIVNGDIYLINTTDAGLLLRMLYTKDHQTFVLRAFNSVRYGEVELQRENIVNIFRIVGRVSYKL